jgi:CBS domain-containing protein
MAAVATELFSLTAADLMGPEVTTVPAGASLAAAAAALTAAGVRGAPVVDEAGRCIGVLTVSDLARRLGHDAPENQTVPLPQTCAFQEECRGPGGETHVVCRLPPGSCALQRLDRGADGRALLGCDEPNTVCSDWQVVLTVPREPSPRVRDLMTTEIVAAPAETPIAELARLMTERHVHRVIVTGPGGTPVGVVSATDLVKALAGGPPGRHE